MNKVVLFLVDGMRPDGLQQARTPVMDKLMGSGSFTLNAQTVMPSVTLPCHMSLFHSVLPERHGVTTNIYTPQVRPVPGLFEVIQQAGLKAAMFHS
jgi:predicted AlkP superfamily pyrophosphatase or phosphodiesterase